MRMVEELSLLPRSIGGDTGLAPWETLMCKANSTSSTSMAMACMPNSCLNAKLQHTKQSKKIHVKFHANVTLPIPWPKNPLINNQAVTSILVTEGNDNYYFLSFSAFSTLFWLERKP